MNQTGQPSTASTASPYKIVISYRRADSQATVDHIYDWLVRAFGQNVIFKDVDSIPPGFEFAPYIEHVMRQCRIVLVVLGPSWSSVLATEGAYSGQPRLADPEDHVRIEVEQALRLAPVDAAGQPTGSVWLIPVLVQNAQMQMLRPEALPASLRPLPARNAWNVHFDPYFTQDMQRLIAHMANWMGVGFNDPLGGGHAPSSLRPPDPVDEMLAVLVPQIRTAFSAEDWLSVIGLSDFLLLRLQTSVDRVPTEVYQMWGRALLAERDYSGAKAAWDMVCRREPLNVAALRAAAEARVGLDTPDELTEALSLLFGATRFTSSRSQHEVLLRVYAQILHRLIQLDASPADIQKHWRDLLRVSDEGQKLTDGDDEGWLSMQLDALEGLGRYDEALALARTLTARPDAIVPWFLARARLAWKLAGETPTDEARQTLDAATRLAPNDKVIETARQLWLVVLPPDRFSPRLEHLGFVATKRNGVRYIAPPLCPVPAGEFLMGSDPRRDKEAQPEELPQHPLKLATFAIGRFPVTVAEYACFVEAQKRQPGKWENQLRKLDHPVTFVSWEDAIAFAAWLARLTGQLWRLPTEAEWEKAARWDAHLAVSRLYPWGDAFDPSRCNTNAGGKVGTTAVGSYPNGASAFGAEEMAGNVWEWTHSLYKPYPYTAGDEQAAERSAEIRVLRGGSWISDSQVARAAYRSLNGPADLDYNIGFRLVLGRASLA